MNIIAPSDLRDDVSATVRQIDNVSSAEKQRIIARKNQIIARLTFGRKKDIVKQYQGNLYSKSSADALSYLIDVYERKFGSVGIMDKLNQIGSAMQGGKNSQKIFYKEFLDTLESEVDANTNPNLFIGSNRTPDYYHDRIKNERIQMTKIPDDDFDNADMNMPGLECLPDRGLIATIHLNTADENNISAYDGKLEQILQESGIDTVTGEFNADKIALSTKQHLKQEIEDAPNTKAMTDTAIDDLKNKL